MAPGVGTRAVSNSWMLGRANECDDDDEEEDEDGADDGDENIVETNGCGDPEPMDAEAAGRR